MKLQDEYYHNAKINIGSMYCLNPLKPKYIEKDRDMILLQSCLISDPERIRINNLLKKAYAILIITLLGYLILIS